MDDIAKLQTRCVSHEIRNHLSICEMYTEIIKKNIEKDSYENSSVMNAIDCIKKSLKIIGTSLIDLKSINNLEINTCELKFLVEESVRLATAYIQGKDIKIDCQVKNSVVISVDENKFLACLVNIIKNAIEAIENRGNIYITADIINGKASIKIANDGKMISKDKQKEIFEEGYTTKLTGSGLGLHICKTNLLLQNAQLNLNKSTKALTEFEIIVPILK